MVAADLTKWCAWGPCRVLHAFGFNNQGTDRYIQFFQKPAAAIAASDVPAIKSLWAAASAAFWWPFAQPFELSELSVGISTTEVNYTAAGAGTGIDMTLVVESECLVGTNTTLVGDLTTAVANKQLWAESAGFKRLLKLEVINNGGSMAGLVIQPSDSANTGAGPNPVIKVAAAETKVLTFGPKGVIPFRNDAGTVRKGCTVRFATPTVAGDTFALPYAFDATTNYNVRAVVDVT